VHQIDDFSLTPASSHMLVFHLDRPVQVAELRNRQGGVLREGSLTILPAGAPTDWHLDRDGDIRHLHVHLEECFLARVATEIEVNPDTVELSVQIGARSAEVEQIGLALLREMRTGGLGGKIYAESLATLLAVQLLRQHSSTGVRTVRAPKALEGLPLKRVTEYIDEHLADDLSLMAVASVATMSPYYFTRLFRNAFGLSPHQYIIRRRVERAMLLLTASDWSLTLIAREVGFASGSHLAFHFKRVKGFTPSHYRRG
jgi:AraC family transcriptional regulator